MSSLSLYYAVTNPASMTSQVAEEEAKLHTRKSRIEEEMSSIEPLLASAKKAVGGIRYVLKNVYSGPMPGKVPASIFFFFFVEMRLRNSILYGVISTKKIIKKIFFLKKK